MGDYLACQDVVQVMLHVQNVVLDYEAERHRSASADGARGIEAFSWDTFDNRRQKRVILRPQGNQKLPVRRLITVDCYPGILTA